MSILKRIEPIKPLSESIDQAPALISTVLYSRIENLINNFFYSADKDLYSANLLFNIAYLNLSNNASGINIVDIILPNKNTNELTVQNIYRDLDFDPLVLFFMTSNKIRSLSLFTPKHNNIECILDLEYLVILLIDAAKIHLKSNSYFRYTKSDMIESSTISSQSWFYYLIYCYDTNLISDERVKKLSNTIRTLVKLEMMRKSFPVIFSTPLHNVSCIRGESFHRVFENDLVSKTISSIIPISLPVRFMQQVTEPVIILKNILFCSKKKTAIIPLLNTTLDMFLDIEIISIDSIPINTIVHEMQPSTILLKEISCPQTLEQSHNISINIKSGALKIFATIKINVITCTCRDEVDNRVYIADNFLHKQFNGILTPNFLVENINRIYFTTFTNIKLKCISYSSESKLIKPVVTDNPLVYDLHNLIIPNHPNDWLMSFILNCLILYHSLPKYILDHINNHENGKIIEGVKNRIMFICGMSEYGFLNIFSPFTIDPKYHYDTDYLRLFGIVINSNCVSNIHFPHKLVDQGDMIQNKLVDFTGAKITSMDKKDVIIRSSSAAELGIFNSCDIVLRNLVGLNLDICAIIKKFIPKPHQTYDKSTNFFQVECWIRIKKIRWLNSLKLPEASLTLDLMVPGSVEVKNFVLASNLKVCKEGYRDVIKAAIVNDDINENTRYYDQIQPGAIKKLCLVFQSREKEIYSIKSVVKIADNFGNSIIFNIGYGDLKKRL